MIIIYLSKLNDFVRKHADSGKILRAWVSVDSFLTFKKQFKTQWFLIETEQDYLTATQRYEEVKRAEKGSEQHKEKMLLVHLIADYEKSTRDLPDLDPIEMIKIRMEDFGYKSADLSKSYGDKGTVSKVLNYKQALSLSMIRKFSQLLHLPPPTLY